MRLRGATGVTFRRGVTNVTFRGSGIGATFRREVLYKCVHLCVPETHGLKLQVRCPDVAVPKKYLFNKETPNSVSKGQGLQV